MPAYTLQINGEKKTVSVDEDTPLLWVLRDELNLVGAKFGCGIAQCGACTVHLNGTAVRSCSLPASALEGQEIVTIEGLSKDGKHPVQEAWSEGGIDILMSLFLIIIMVLAVRYILKRYKKPKI